MNAMECSPSNQSPTGSDHEDEEISALSQQIDTSLPSGSQRSISNRNATPEVQDLPDRLQSIPVSDPGALYGAEGYLSMSSQGGAPPSSQNSIRSQSTDRHGDRPNVEGRGGGAGNARQGAHYSMNRMLPNSIYDSQRFPFPLRRFWHPDGLLVCTDRHREYLYSQAKCMGLAPNTEKSESYGMTWSLVFPFEGFGLPEQMIQALHFFSTIQSLSTHNKMNKYVVQTNNLQDNLYLSYNDKDVTGVLEGRCADDAGDRHDHVPGSADLSDLLQSCENSSSGIVFKALPLLRMNIGVTGALYNVGSKEKRKLFGILYVHWLLNVDFMQLMLVSLVLDVRVCVDSMAEARVLCRKPSWRCPAPRPPTLTMSTRRATLFSTPSSRSSSIRPRASLAISPASRPGISSKIRLAGWAPTICATPSGSRSRC